MVLLRRVQDTKIQKRLHVNLYLHLLLATIAGNHCDQCHNFSSLSAFLFLIPIPFRLIFVGVEGYCSTSSHSMTHTNTRWASSGREIGRPQRPLFDKAQRPKQTDIHSPGRIRTLNRNKRDAENLRLKSRSQRDRLCSSSRNKIEASAIIWRH